MKDLTPERLTRLLAMIAYFADGRAVSVSDAAEHFAITPKQLLDDIDTLWLSGAPGYGHAELIDFEATALDKGVVQLRNSQQMDQPLRLAPGEAVTLLVALNSLIARLGETDVLNSTREKLVIAAGEAAHAADAVMIERTSVETHSLRNDIDSAIRQLRSLRLTYVSGRHEVTTRTVNPQSLHAVGDHWVLSAWCHRAEADRQFRLDRILDFEFLNETFTPPAAPPVRTSLDASEFDQFATLRLTSAATWLLEQIPYESLERHSDSFTVVIASAHSRWLQQLCLRLGDELLSIEPAQLAEAVSTRAQSALDLYGE